MTKYYTFIQCYDSGKVTCRMLPGNERPDEMSGEGTTFDWYVDEHDTKAAALKFIKEAKEA